ncbi:T6SS immunity protein Tli3 family protein [Rahnella selenatireducens]|uniref:T6SS immunity protein Tli3 family protein n=1 Tax=Rahnella selenatireducens TaxID=3389797 RepID=UPI00396940DA
MKDENKSSDTRDALKVVSIIAALFFGLWLLWNVVVSMLPTIGGSFGAGFPSGSGGRAIRDVEIDVEPQVIYRIDGNRFFTLEKYMDCNLGGFVYYNDTKKKIKVLAGPEGSDQDPQDEISILQPNGPLSFSGKFIYAASDDVIAYLERHENSKYGLVTYSIVYTDISTPSKNAKLEVSPSIYNTNTVTDDAIYVQVSNRKEQYQKYSIPKISDDPEWISSSDVKFNNASQDDHFYCDNTIKPRSVKYISN